MTPLNRTPEEMNNALHEEILKLFEGRKIDGKNQSIVYKNVRAADKDATYHDVADAVNRRGTVSRRYKADIDIVNKETGDVISSKKGVFIGDVPQYTKKGGMIVNGNTYVVPNQIRLKPGAYTLNKASGDVETMLNTAGGRSLKVVSPSESDNVKIHIGTRGFNAYDVAKILGASDKEIEKTLGKGVTDTIKQKSDEYSTAVKMAQSLGIIGSDITPPKEELYPKIREYFSKSKLDPSVTKITLGKPVDNVNKDTILLSVKKNVAVKRGEEKEDDKENLMFKKVVTPEKLIAEGVNRELRKAEGKMRFKLSNPFQKVTVDDVVKNPTLKDAAHTFVTTSAISRMPEEYNPLQIVQNTSDITPVGEGGISSAEMITPAVRSLHMSQLGFIDPIKSPEGAKTGVTLSTTHGAHVDKEGNPAIRVKNLRTGKEEIKQVGHLWGKKVAFPDVKENGKVGIRHGDEIVVGHIKDADYQLTHPEDMYGPAMNSLALISANDPTRNLMASKHITQALPLAEPDVNPVQLASKNGKSLLEEIGKKHLPKAAVNGVVQSVDDKAGKIVIKGSDGKTYKEDFSAKPIQLNTKTFLKHTPIVKPGDKVKKGQPLADSNFTRGGKLALGKNLRAAWMMYPGTRNDAFVVSESGAKKLTSVHSAKFDVDSSDTVYDKKKFATMFPEIAKKIDLDKYDERGFLREGETVAKDEPVSLGFRKMDPQEARFANDKVKKLLYGGMVPVVEKWKYDNQGRVTSIASKGNKHRIIAEYKAPLQVGDKVAGRSGNKGVISAVIPDDKMPRDEEGKPIDIILGGAGVISRQNPAQLIEGALTAVSEKTGKQYVLPHYVPFDLTEFAKNEAKKHDVKLYHKIYDPQRKIELKQKVFVAPYNVLKLFKQGEGTYSATGHGATDMLGQPKKGGKESAASISNMEINALLAHDARDFLREAATIRSQRNKEWFSAFEQGRTPPPPEEKTARQNFFHLLKQMNINVKNENGKRMFIPMTDSDVKKISAGEVREPHGLKRNTLTPVEGGLYDQKIFGKDGVDYGHIDLGTHIINPLYKKHVAGLVGMSESELDKHIQKGGLSAIKEKLVNVNPVKEIKRLKAELKNTKRPDEADRKVKAIKALKKIDALGKTPSDVMLISKVPVLPPVVRPTGKLPGGGIIEHDVNEHYSTIIRAANTLKDIKNSKMLPADEKEAEHKNRIVAGLEHEIQQHVGGLYGTNPPADPKLKNRDVKSMLDIVGGSNPKTSYWHQKILKNKVFTSGRAVVVPHNKSLGIDQVEIPKFVAWKSFEPHVKRKMSQMGIPTHEAEEMIEKKHPTAESVLHQVMKEVPVVINRAPSLHKHNMTGHYAKIASGNVMHVPPEVEPGHNMDYDGDQLAIHVPLTPKAISDVKNKLMASKQLLTNSQAGKLNIGIDLDPFIGFYDATKHLEGKTKGAKRSKKR